MSAWVWVHVCGFGSVCQTYDHLVMALEKVATNQTWVAEKMKTINYLPILIYYLLLKTCLSLPISYI